MSSAALDPFHTFRSILCAQCYHDPHFTDEETEDPLTYPQHMPTVGQAPRGWGVPGSSGSEEACYTFLVAQALPWPMAARGLMQDQGSRTALSPPQ